MQVPPWRKTQLFFSPATEAAAGLGDAQPGGQQGEGEEGEGEGEEVEEEEEEEQEEEEAIERGRGEEVNFPTTWRNKCLYFHSSQVTAWDYLFLTKLTLEKKISFQLGFSLVLGPCWPFRIWNPLLLSFAFRQSRFPAKEHCWFSLMKVCHFGKFSTCYPPIPELINSFKTRSCSIAPLQCIGRREPKLLALGASSLSG